jgi:hypothetical protein
MKSNIYDSPNYDMVQGIKIYTGTTKYSAAMLKKNIGYYKSLTQPQDKLFTELVPSTLTAKGKFNNIEFCEEDIIDMLSVPVGGYILKICCNYGVVVNPSPDYVYPPPKVRVSNRGRKPKIKPKSKRKLQGSGKYFSSQITFEIYNPDNNKIYKIKLFRNGGFQVPGVNKPDVSDLIKPIITLRDYLRKEFVDENINIQYFISVMRNYICKINNPQLLIRLNTLETLFKDYKDSLQENPIRCIIDQIPDITDPIKEEIKQYIGQKNNKINMAEIQNNCERYFGLILKFYRPVPWKIDKRTTIKILRSGKLNIDGGNSIDEAHELYHWLENVFTKNYNIILYDPAATYDDSEEYEIGSGQEIYDGDLIPTTTETAEPTTTETAEPTTTETAEPTTTETAEPTTTETADKKTL